MILETLSILGAGVALIAVQPPLRKWFPEKPKKTVWEEFWAEAEGRQKHWERCGVGCTSDSSDIADHVLAAAKKPDSIAHAYETLRTRYVPQIKEALEDSSRLMKETKAEARKPTTARYETAETDIEAVNAAIARKATVVWLPETKAWVDIDGEPRIPEPPRSMPTLGSEEWQKKGPTEPAFEQRRRLSDYAAAYGKQVYLDHATNEYRVKEKPVVSVRIPDGVPLKTADADYCSLAANQARLEEALFRAHYENGRAALEQARSMAPRVVGSADSDMSFAMYQQKLQQAKLEALLKK